MAKISNIYPKIFDFDNLYHAYLSARKGKRYRGDVLKFTSNLEEELIELQNELIWQTYNVGHYRQFYVYEPKKRLIMALQFRDRVVQWAIYRQLNPLFDRQYIFDSYGCRNGKGAHRAADRLQYWMRAVNRKPGKWYYLKLDVSKYFYRVDHAVLLGILRKKIDDEKLMALFERIINSETTKFGLPLGMDADKCRPEDRLSDVGMPIGNLTSQMFANIYLNELDQFVKHQLRIHYYVRYMDDIIILDRDKKHLKAVKDVIEKFLNNRLHLNLNRKTAIRPISDGIEFVGFRIFATHRKLKRSSIKKMKSRLKYLQKAYSVGAADFGLIDASLKSYFGIMQHFNSFGLRSKISRTLVFKRSGIDQPKAPA